MRYLHYRARSRSGMIAHSTVAQRLSCRCGVYIHESQIALLIEILNRPGLKGVRGSLRFVEDARRVLKKTRYLSM